MRRADIAELILSFATPRERAASIAGDFLEEEPRAFRFWFLVGRTAIAQTWRQVIAEPEALVGVMIRGMIVESGYFLAACILYVVLLVIVISIFTVSFHTDISACLDASLQWSVVNLFVPFSLGRWMARRYSGREAGGTLALASLHTTINLVAALVLREAAQAGASSHLDVILGLKLFSWDSHDCGAILHSAMLCATLYPVVVLAGAARFRARALR